MVKQFDKLVRDCIPQIIEESGNTCTFRRAEDTAEHHQRLKLKSLEEAYEFIENPCYEEAADMIEVGKALCYLNGLEWEAALSAAVNKQETNGGFHNGTILQNVIYEYG